MPPWVLQKRPEGGRFDDTLWGDSNTTRRPGRKNRSRQPESDSGKGTGDADDSDDPPAKDEVPLHTRLTKYADAVDSPSMHTMSSKTPEDELAGRADWYRKRWYSIDPNAGFRGKWDLSQAAILLYVAMVVPFRVGYRPPAEGGWSVVAHLIDRHFYGAGVLNFPTGEGDPEDGERGIYQAWASAGQ